MLEQRIQQHFIDSADLQYQAAQALGKPVEAAIQALTACVTGGGKVLAAGSAGSAALAQHFASCFVGSFERERPELAALALTTNGSILAPRGDVDPRQVFARQVRALGLAGDVLLMLSSDGQSASAQAAIEAAHERDMAVVALTGRDGGRVGALLRETDVHVCVPHERAARVHETHLLILHSICDGVDAQLLGEQEPST